MSLDEILFDEITSLYNICEYAFSNSGIKDLDLFESGVGVIRQRTFEGCSKFETLVLPEVLSTTIGPAAFRGCELLKKKYQKE